MAFHEYSSFCCNNLSRRLAEPAYNVQYVVGHLIRDMQELGSSKCCLG